MTKTNNELTDFQKQVFAEYRTVKVFGESSGNIDKGRKNRNKGWLFLLIFMFTDWFISKIMRNERRKRDFAGNEREARELLRQKEISDGICEMIAKISSKEILTEEKFVYELTAALYRSDLASRFIIPENAVLYAMMATEVFNIGLENFCNDQKGDK